MPSEGEVSLQERLLDDIVDVFGTTTEEAIRLIFESVSRLFDEGLVVGVPGRSSGGSPTSAYLRSGERRIRRRWQEGRHDDRHPGRSLVRFIGVQREVLGERSHLQNLCHPRVAWAVSSGSGLRLSTFTTRSMDLVFRSAVMISVFFGCCLSVAVRCQRMPRVRLSLSWSSP